MRVSRGAAFVAFALAATVPLPARADGPLVIVVSGTGTLPVDKIADHIRAALPALRFTIRATPELRTNVARGRLVRWEDGRVAVGFRDALEREDVRIVHPTADHAAEIARAFVELRAGLLEQPIRQLAEDVGSVPERSPYIDDLLSDAFRASQDVSPPLRLRRAYVPPRGRVALSIGFGNGGVQLGSAPRVNPYGTLGALVTMFPARFANVDGPARWFGLAVGGHVRSGGLSYASHQIDVSALVEIPLDPGGRLRWLQFATGWRSYAQSTHDSDTLDGFDQSFGGLLWAVDGGLVIEEAIFVTAGLGAHAVSQVGIAALDGSADDERHGLGWMARLGVGERSGGPLDWTIDLELVRYAVDLGDETIRGVNVQWVMGLGYVGR